MYTLFSRNVPVTNESPYACVKEHQGVLYGFWIRPVRFCSNDVCILMDKAINQAFESSASGKDLGYDDIINRIFREWTYATLSFHEKEGKPFSANIFKNYAFEMQVLIFPSYGGCIVKKYDMNGETDKCPATDKDIVTVSLSPSDNYMGSSKAEYSGIICFREKEPAGKGYSQNRHIYDWERLITSVAEGAIDSEEALDPDSFDGSFLLAVDMDKLELYRSRDTEKRPYIIIDIHEGSFGVYAETGKIYYADMELINGYSPLTEEYFEFTEVAEDEVRFIVNKKYTDGVKEQEVLLKKGESKVFGYETEEEWTTYDGSDLIRTNLWRIKVSWDK